MKRALLILSLSTAFVSIAHQPDIANMADTPCGQKKCACPKELKKAYEAEQIKKLGLDPKLIEALNYHAKKQKKEETEEALQETKTHLAMDGAFTAAGLLTVVFSPAVLGKNKDNVTTINSAYFLGITALLAGSYFGLRDAATYYHQKQTLNKLN